MRSFAVPALAFVIPALLGLGASAADCAEPLGRPPIVPSYGDGGWDCPPGMEPYLLESLPRCVRTDGGS